MSIRATNWAAKVFETADLTATQRLVLLALCHHHHDASDACFPSMATIAAFAGVTDRRARTAMRDLEALGLVSSFKRVTSRGMSSNHYELFGRLKRADKKSRPRPDATVLPTGRTLASPDKDISILEREEAPAKMRVILGGRS